MSAHSQAQRRRAGAEAHGSTEVSRVLAGRRVCVAARGWAAVRIAQSVRALGGSPVGVVVREDRDAGWVEILDDCREVPSYTDSAALVTAARALGAEIVHPGLGFLAENRQCAAACEAAGLIWAGPNSEVLAQVSDKARLAPLAASSGVRAPRTSAPLRSVEELRAWMRENPAPTVLKASHGGGGRGVVVVHDPQEAWAQLDGLGPLIAQEWLPAARHIEVQAVGDASGHIITLGTRECSVQRRWQKLIEQAPAQIPDSVREQVTTAAVQLLSAAHYAGVGTVEFLLPTEGEAPQPLLLEVNARLQVEHSVTEAVEGIDLVACQLLLAAGWDLEGAVGAARACYGQPQAAHAMNARLYAEHPHTGIPSTGMLTHLAIPTWRASAAGAASAGSATDTASAVSSAPAAGAVPGRAMPGPAAGAVPGRAVSGRAMRSGPGTCTTAPLPLTRTRVLRGTFPGDALRPHFSEPLALITVSGEDESAVREQLAGTVEDTEVDGPDTLAPLLTHILRHPDMRAHRVDTAWLTSPRSGWDWQGVAAPGAQDTVNPTADAPGTGTPDGDTPNAGRQSSSTATAARDTAISLPIAAPLGGTLTWIIAPGTRVRRGEQVAVIEAMKMRVPIPAPAAGTIAPAVSPTSTERGQSGAPGRAAAPATGQTGSPGRAATPATGQTVAPGDCLATLLSQEPGAVTPPPSRVTARSRADSLVDAGSLDGVVDDDSALTAYATIGGRRVGLWVQDPTVRGGTIGIAGARRVAALIEDCARTATPIVSVFDGGGARIHEGSTALSAVGLILRAIVSAHGRTLHIGLITGAAAGGAAYAPALCDLTLMVRGQGQMFLTGPAVVRDATGERISAEVLGGAQVHATHAGTVHRVLNSTDSARADLITLLRFAPRRCGDGELRPILAPSRSSLWQAPADAAIDRQVPADFGAPYDVRPLLHSLTDRSELLELRPDFAPSVVTALAHLHGQPVAIVANQPSVAAGSLTPEASQKITEHCELARRLRLPVITIVDTPGFLPGRDAEAAGTIRHGSHLVSSYVGLLSSGDESGAGNGACGPHEDCLGAATAGVGASSAITLITRRAYGGAFVALGSRALSGAATFAWEGARIGVIDPGSAVDLIHRRELEQAAQEGEQARLALRECLIEAQYEAESAVHAQEAGWVDAVISPARTRSALAQALAGLPAQVTARPSRGHHHDGDGWVDCRCGRRHWGLGGAAGVLLWRLRPQAEGARRVPRLEVLLQLRAAWTHHGSTWGLPGGAIARGEDAATGALRECSEETGIPSHLITLGGSQVQQHPDWSYTTFVGRAHVGGQADRLLSPDGESQALAWVPLDTDSTTGTWALPSPGPLGATGPAGPVRPVEPAALLGTVEADCPRAAHESAATEALSFPVLPALSAIWEDLAALLPSPQSVAGGHDEA